MRSGQGGCVLILVFEQDLQDHGQGRFNWRPSLFRGRWSGGLTWRVAWGLWSLSYYPSPGLRQFFDHIESGSTGWVSKS
jgi:hypothetical protein